MTKNLSEIVGNTAVKILRDVYIYGVRKNQLPDKHNVQTIEIDLVIEKVERHIVYESRAHNYNVNMSRRVFTKDDLIKWVWRDFLHEQMDGGKNTGQIAQEIGVPLEKVNSFLM